MPPENAEPVDLVDLKLLPAWVKESPGVKEYAHYEAEAEERPRGRDRHSRDNREPRKRPTANERPSGSDQRPTFKLDKKRSRRPQDRHGRDRPAFGGQDRHRAPERAPLEIGVRFLPPRSGFESVAAQ